MMRGTLDEQAHGTRAMHQYRFAVILLTLALDACSTSAPATASSANQSDLDGAGSSSGPSVRWLGHDAAALHRPLRFRVTNPTDALVHVLGFYSLRDPATQIEVAQSGTWVDKTRVRACGVGIAWLALGPGEAAEFDVWVDTNDNPTFAPMRIGVTYRSRGGDLDEPESWLTAWTPAFVPDELFDYDVQVGPLERR